eukprot:scaffold75832_cov39-Cyclotella_meneghiniana.AAC.3
MASLEISSCSTDSSTNSNSNVNVNSNADANTHRYQHYGYQSNTKAILPTCQTCHLLSPSGPITTNPAFLSKTEVDWCFSSADIMDPEMVDCCLFADCYDLEAREVIATPKNAYCSEPGVERSNLFLASCLSNGIWQYLQNEPSNESVGGVKRGEQCMKWLTYETERQIRPAT